VYSAKYRALMGNVGLTLFLAFLFMLNPFTLYEARVLAAPDYQVDFGNAQVTVGAGGMIQVPMTITPLTQPFSGTIEVTLYFRKGGETVGQGVYRTAIDSAYSVYYNAYQILVNVAYQAPATFTPGTKLQLSPGSVSVGNVVYVSVYLDEVPVPPPEGPGAPSPVVGGPVTSIGTDTGWISVDPSTGAATGYVDLDLALRVLASPPPEGATLLDMGKVKDLTGKLPENVIGNIPGNVLQQASYMGTKLVRLDTGTMGACGDPKVFMTDALQAAGPLAVLRLRSKVASTDETKKILESMPQDVTKDLKPASRLYSVSFWVVPLTGPETKVDNFNGQATFFFAYDPNLVSIPEHLNVYERGSLRYVGGKVDLVNKRVGASLSGFKTGEFIVMEHTKTFADVPEGYWGKKDIELMASKYVVKGKTEAAFEPESLVTRAEYITMLVRALGLPEARPEKATFSDVLPNSWYYGYVEAAAKAGLAQGDSGKGGRFRPEEQITREEMAALMVRAMTVQGKPPKALDVQEVGTLLSGFTDGDKVASWARLEMAQAINEGIIKGRDANLIAPSGNGKRAEAATMMSRFMIQVGLI